MRGIARPSLIAALATAAQPGAAQTSKSFQVSARIVPGCIVTTDAGGRWGDIDLGTVAGVAGTSVEATLVSRAAAGLVIDCTPGVAASLAADKGDNAVAGERHLIRAGGTERVAYRLYADGATTAWSGAVVPIAFAGAVRVIPIRAVAAIAAAIAAGRYTDTVRITLSW